MDSFISKKFQQSPFTTLVLILVNVNYHTHNLQSYCALFQASAFGEKIKLCSTLVSCFWSLGVIKLRMGGAQYVITI